ncbi:MAG TPA: chromate transporter [Spirochaetaceae bacterium]|nr:chromate transporter [Spirochaetaceae bacterium]
MSLALTLFIEYFRIGLFAFGGGMATIPFLLELTVKYPAWFTVREVADMLAISEGTPGPIGINMSTYCGYKVMGIPGSLISTFSLVLPAFIVLFIVSKYMRFKENRIVKSALTGLKVAVVVLIMLAFYNLFSLTFYHAGASNVLGFAGSIIDLREVALFALCFAASGFFKKINPVVFVLLCGAVTCVLF